MSNAVHGLSHVALKVANLDRAVRFYEIVFGVRQYVRESTTAQVLGPGAADVIAFFGNNQPYAFIRDPDGYQIEIWHENTPLHLT